MDLDRSDKIDDGSEGTQVYQVSLDLTIALKLIEARKSEKEIDELKGEAALEHDNVLQTFEIEKDGDYIAQRMELMLNNLTENIGGVDNKFVKVVGYNKYPTSALENLLRQLGQGVQFLHSKRLMVKNLKPGTIFYKGETVKISHIFVKKQPYPAFRAPEETNGAGNEKADMFRIALVIWYCLTNGFVPFNQSEYVDLVSANDEGNEYQRIIGIRIDKLNTTPEVELLLRDLLTMDPLRRYSLGNFLLHPLFWSHNTKLDFLTDVSNTAEEDGKIYDGKVTQCIQAAQVEAIGPMSVGASVNEWKDKILVLYQDMVSPRPGEKINRPSYEPLNELKTLVRLIRNARAHDKTLYGMTTKMLDSFGGLYPYIEAQFPRLLMAIYEELILGGCSTRPQFLRYYTAPI